MPEYNIITLEAAEILRRAKAVQQAEGEHQRAEFHFDLSPNSTDPMARNVVRSVDRYADSGFYYQLAACVPTVAGENADPADILREYIVFVDFSSQLALFEQAHLQEINYRSLSAKELEGGNERGLEACLAWLFDPTNGLYLTFGGNKRKRFVPFDKSNSMARVGRIAFIDDGVREQLNKRLLLDMDFAEIKVNPSKYYAYRGLYLSNGCRIEQTADFRLDAETLVVVPDKNTRRWEGNLFQAIGEAAKTETDLWKFGTVAESSETNINSFDGEGLICPAYAQFISEQLQQKYNFPRASHSFQIRLPFMKGMLHEVDFAAFYREFIGAPPVITDIFGQKRDLSKARIIMTEGMFKGAKWLKVFWGKRADDPMAYFAAKMREYGHTLYITGSDARQSRGDRTKLNYQFLSTLAVEPTDFATWVREQGRMAQREQIVAELLEGRNSTEDAAEDDDAAPTTGEKGRDKCLRALQLNDAFLTDPIMQQIIRQVRQGREKDLGIGRLEVLGETRYLSGDLLVLLQHIAEQGTGYNQARLEETVNRELIAPSKFYLPEKCLKMKADKYYVFLRNPHLSRNEQAMLKPYRQSGNVYERYFSHLTGLVMVAYDSLIPMCVGGADFDGDLVRIIAEPAVVNAVKNTVYQSDGVTRELPIIKIPSAGSGEMTPDRGYVPFEVICNTFSNQIGNISNLAVKIAKLEYGDNAAAGSKYAGKCAECTCVTGLEIDAAKNGLHPKANIKALTALVQKEKSVFLRTKAALTKLYSQKSDRMFGSWAEIKLSGKEYSLGLKGRNKPYLEHIQMYNATDKVANIERLPGAYVRYRQEQNDAAAAPVSAAEQQKKKSPLFVFQLENNWAEELAEDKKKAVSRLSAAYLRVTELARRLEKLHRINREGGFGGHIHTRLDIQYDSLSEMLTCGVSVEEALRQATGELAALVTTRAEADEALRRLSDSRWPFTPAEERLAVMRGVLGLPEREDAEETEFSTAVVELLCNFRANGYMLLYYLLKELQRRFYEEMDSDEFLAHNGEMQKRKFTVPQNNPYWEELYLIYSVSAAAKESRDILRQKLTAKCRERLEELFAGDMDAALKYAAAENSKREFVWDVFRSEEILRNVCRAKGGDGANVE